LGARREACYEADDGDALWPPFSSMEACVDAPCYSPVMDLLGENLVPVGRVAVALSVSSPSLEALPLKFACHGAQGQPSPSLGVVCGCRRRLWSCHALRLAMELFVVLVHASYSSTLMFVQQCGRFSGGCFVTSFVVSLADTLPLTFR
jgi:hypothetical protein